MVYVNKVTVVRIVRNPSTTGRCFEVAKISSVCSSSWFSGKSAFCERTNTTHASQDNDKDSISIVTTTYLLTVVALQLMCWHPVWTPKRHSDKKSVKCFLFSQHRRSSTTTNNHLPESALLSGTRVTSDGPARLGDCRYRRTNINPFTFFIPRKKKPRLFYRISDSRLGEVQHDLLPKHTHDYLVRRSIMN